MNCHNFIVVVVVMVIVIIVAFITIAIAIADGYNCMLMPFTYYRMNTDEFVYSGSYPIDIIVPAPAPTLDVGTGHRQGHVSAIEHVSCQLQFFAEAYTVGA